MAGWYNEINDFTYGDQGANSFSAVGHYTQVTISSLLALRSGIVIGSVGSVVMISWRSLF